MQSPQNNTLTKEQLSIKYKKMSAQHIAQWQQRRQLWLAITLCLLAIMYPLAKHMKGDQFNLATFLLLSIAAFPIPQLALGYLAHGIYETRQYNNKQIRLLCNQADNESSNTDSNPSTDNPTLHLD